MLKRPVCIYSGVQVCLFEPLRCKQFSFDSASASVVALRVWLTYLYESPSVRVVRAPVSLAVCRAEVYISNKTSVDREEVWVHILGSGDSVYTPRTYPTD